MALRKGFGAQLSGANADDLRYDMAGTVVRSSAGVPRSGLFPPVASPLLTPTASMAVGIAAFSGLAMRDNGVVYLANVGADSVTLDAPPSSNSRLDVVWAKQNDASAYVSTPDANNTPVFGVLKGVASATPVRNPAGLPQGAIELGTVLVPSTATNTGSAGVVITPTFQYVVAVGGILPVPTLALLNTITGSIGLLYAEVVADSTLANNGLYKWYNGAWTPRGMSWESVKAAIQLIASSTPVAVHTLVLPATAPPGKYRVHAYEVGVAAGATQHYWKIDAGSVNLSPLSYAVNGPAGTDVVRSDAFSYDHPGGAVTITMTVQINGASAGVREGTRLMATWVG